MQLHKYDAIKFPDTSGDWDEDRFSVVNHTTGGQSFMASVVTCMWAIVGKRKVTSHSHPFLLL